LLLKSQRLVGDRRHALQFDICCSNIFTDVFTPIQKVGHGLIPIFVLSGGLALIPATGRIAAYVTVRSISRLITSIVLSMLGLILVAKLAWPAGGSSLGGAALIISYIGGMAFGGLL
jgi:hypothetical protein